MIQRIKLQAVALLVLGVCCALYQFTFVAWLQPPPLPKLNLASAPAMRPNKSLAHLFPPGSWQLGNCKRLQTRDGALLFENWTQLGDDQWKLWPLTVVLGAGSDSPLILDAVEGAEIKFSESLDVMSGGAPPIERGRMIGQVRIRSVGKGFSLNPDDDGPTPKHPATSKSSPATSGSITARSGRPNRSPSASAACGSKAATSRSTSPRWARSCRGATAPCRSLIAWN